MASRRPGGGGARGKGSRQRVWIAAGLLLVALGFGLPRVGAFLVVADPLEPADAVVPLAGDRSRVLAAAELFGEGYARWYAISQMRVENPNPTISYAESVRAQAIERGVPPDRIIVLPGTAATTYEEAVNLRRAARERGWRSLIVVTSPYHARRARLILRDAFAPEIRLILRPTAEPAYPAERWWTTPEGRRATLEEYLKLAAYLLGYHGLARPGLDGPASEGAEPEGLTGRLSRYIM